MAVVGVAGLPSNAGTSQRVLDVLENDLLQLPELPSEVALCSNAACDSFHDKLIGQEV
jgi:hypothetical protein